MILIREKLKNAICQLSLFTALALGSTTGFAGIYKWVDAEGNVHYGQQRPTNSPSEKVQVQQYTPRDTSTYKRPGTKDGSKDDKKTAPTAEPEERKETAAEKKRRLASCDQVRQNIAQMESRGRIRSKDKDGNLVYLSQADKEAKMAKSQSFLSKNCK
jgi:Domain of unknown function (DUF4124)